MLWAVQPAEGYGESIEGKERAEQEEGQPEKPVGLGLMAGRRPISKMTWQQLDILELCPDGQIAIEEQPRAATVPPPPHIPHLGCFRECAPYPLHRACRSLLALRSAGHRSSAT